MNSSESLIDRKGKCITFYSYKGGVGRSMALVNVACLLAKKNKKVLVIDWDVEAPGLHLFFDVNKNKPGLVDFFTDLVQFVKNDKNNNEDAYLSFFDSELDNHIDRDILISNDEPLVKLDILKAGKFDDEYSGKLNSINWQDIYKHSPALFRTFAYYLEKEYDFILIDSRTGLADSCGITTMLMPQKMVLVFAINNQNINGVLDIANQVIDYRLNSYDYRGLDIYPLPSRIENTVAPDLLEWIANYQTKFEQLFNEKYLLDGCDLSAYFDRCSIPYYPIHAHGENIPVLRETTTNPTFISYNYDRFLTVLLKDIPAWETISIEQEAINDKLIKDKFIEAVKLQESGELLKSIELYDSIIEYEPNNHATYYLRGIVKSEINDDRGAMDDFDMSIALSSSDALPYYYRGNLKEKIEDFEGAILDYSKAIEFKPDYVDALINRGKVKGLTGDDQGALNDLNSAVKFKPAYSKKIIDGQRQPIIVGLDIGTTKVVVIAGRKNDVGKLEILGFGKADSAGVGHGVILNIDQCIRSIESAIDKCLISNPNLDIKDVYVGISGLHIKSLQTQGERVRSNTTFEIDKEDIGILVRDQYRTYVPSGDEIIDIVPQEFVIDGTPNIIDPIGMSGIKIGANFHIITGDKNAIRNIKRCVDKSGLNIRDIVLQPLASAASVMSDDDMEAGVAIVDIGGGTTDIAVFHDGILKHTAIIPYGSINITNDIRNGLGVLRVQAEQMKVQFGMALADTVNNTAYITIPGLRGLPTKEISLKNVANIIQARMQEILDYVVYHLKQVDLDKKLYGGIILTGGGAQLTDIVRLTEYVTGLNVRIGYANEHLENNHIEALANPMYATSIGLILRGYHDYENGRLPFSNVDGNLLHISDDGFRISNKDQIIDNPDNSNTKERSENFKKLFDRLKGKFIELFEDVEADKEIENPSRQITKRTITQEELEERERFEQLKLELEERAERLRRMSFNVTSNSADDEIQNVPAYVRKNIELDRHNVSSDTSSINDNYDANELKVLKYVFLRNPDLFTSDEKNVMTLYLGIDILSPMNIQEITEEVKQSIHSVITIIDSSLKKLAQISRTD